LNPAALRFEYIPYPIWRRTLPPLIKQGARALYRNFYPVTLDEHPPHTPQEVAAYLRRWHQLDVSAQDVADVSLTLLDATAPQAPRAPLMSPLRLPAQWETLEAVLLRFPTMYPALWPLHAAMIEAISQVCDVHVAVPAPLWANAAALYLTQRSRTDMRRVTFMHLPADDIWIRDYGPIVGHQADGTRAVYEVTYHTHDTYPQTRDADAAGLYAALRGFPSQRIRLTTEGGNLLTDGQGTLYMTTQLFNANPQFTRESLEGYLHELFTFDKLIMPPYLNIESTGHVDLIIKLARTDTVFVSAPNHHTDRAILTQVNAIFARESNAHGQRLNVVPLPTLPPYWNWFFYGIRRSYTNALTVNGRVLVPIYRVPEDDIALKAYADTLPDYEIVPIDCAVGVNGGGAVHCMTKEVPSSAAR
jgi:agmatine deiminase